MLKIKSLTFVNIGRFVEPQTINFELLGPLVQVDGLNMNTGGSSGAGKSTFFHALDYLFGINEISNSRLQCRLTKSAISVSGVFDYDGQELKITRSKKLTIELGGEVITGSSKLAEEKLDEIIGVSRDLFQSMLHKRQKEGGFFLNLTPKGAYDFLTDCMNLKELKAQLAIVVAEAQSLEKKITEKTSDVRTFKASLDATESAQKTLGPKPEVTITRDRIVVLETALIHAKRMADEQRVAFEQELHQISQNRPAFLASAYDEAPLTALYEQQKKLQNEIAAQELERAKSMNAVREKIALAKSEYEKISAANILESSKWSQKKREAVLAQEQALKYAGEIKKVRANVCFTCDQPWLTDAAKTKEQELLVKITACKEIIQAGASATAEIDRLAEELRSLAAKYDRFYKEQKNTLEILAQSGESDFVKSNIEKIRASILEETKKKNLHFASLDQKNKEAQESFDQQLRIRTSGQKKIMDGLNEAHAKAKQNLDAANTAIRAQEDALRRHELIVSQLAQQHATALAKLTVAEKELADLTEKFQMAEEAKRAIKSYTSRLFDEALESISETATRIIRQIPNMENATIQLNAIKETADGKIKEEVNAIIHNDGEENVPIETLSGGERTSADLAVDLAAIQFLEERAGKGIDLFILDEPFNGLESVNIQAIVEMLKMTSISKRIMIVDHNPIVAECFESKIVIKRNGAISLVA